MPVAEWTTDDTRFVQVSGACARTFSGSVYCFDQNLGRYTPKAGLSAMATISVGTHHGCGLTYSGTALCWGANDVGQLGDGSRTYSEAPVSVSGEHLFTQIAVGEYHTCGLTSDQEAWCWGATHRGQAGSSILDPALVPERIHGQGGS